MLCDPPGSGIASQRPRARVSNSRRILQGVRVSTTPHSSSYSLSPHAPREMCVIRQPFNVILRPVAKSPVKTITCDVSLAVYVVYGAADQEL